MSKRLDFFKEFVNDFIDEKSLNFGVCKAIDILFELNIEDEKIKQLLVKHFDLKYSEAQNILFEAREQNKG